MFCLGNVFEQRNVDGDVPRGTVKFFQDNCVIITPQVL